MRFDIQLAQYYSYRGEYDAALRYLDDARNTDPANPVSYIGISYILSEVKEDHDGAIEAIMAGLLQAPADTRLLNNFAYNHLMKGNIEKGRQVLDSISENDALENPLLLATRGLLLVKEGALEEGARLYNQASHLIENEEMNAQVRQKKNLEIGRYLESHGNKGRAKRVLEDVLSIESHTNIYKQQATRLLGTI